MIDVNSLTNFPRRAEARNLTMFSNLYVSKLFNVVNNLVELGIP